MDTRKVANEYREAHWTQVFTEYKQSEQTIEAFCAERGFTPNTFHYWQRKLREKAIRAVQEAHALPALAATESSSEETPSGWIKLVPVSVTPQVEDKPESSTWVVMNGCWIEVMEGTSPTLLSKILKAVKEAC